MSKDHTHTSIYAAIYVKFMPAKCGRISTFVLRPIEFRSITRNDRYFVKILYMEKIWKIVLNKILMIILYVKLF